MKIDRVGGMLMHWVPRFRTAALVMAAAVSLSQAGCGPRNFDNENDRLRALNLELQREVEGLQERLELRTGELQSLRQQLERAQNTQPLEGAEPPVLSRLVIGRLSGAFDTNSDGTDDVIRVYLEPQDQRGRLLPVAGRARVRAVHIPDEGEPTVLAERTYQPAEFDAAWRSGITGRHFTLELPLPQPLPEGVDQVTVRVELTQAGTGAELSAQQPVTLASE